MKMSLYTAMQILEQLDTISEYKETVSAPIALTISWVDAVCTPVRMIRDTYTRSDAEHLVYVNIPVSADHLTVLRQTYEKAKEWLERHQANKQD